MSFLDKVSKFIANAYDALSTAQGVSSALKSDPYERIVGNATAEAGHALSNSAATNRAPWQNQASVNAMTSYANGIPQGGQYYGSYGPQPYGPISPYQGMQGALNRGQYYQNQQYPFVDMGAINNNILFGGTTNARQLALTRMSNNSGGRWS